MVDIVVSHGFFIDETAQQLGRARDGYCDYCAITEYKLEKQSGQDVKTTLLMGACDDHVLTKA